MKVALGILILLVLGFLTFAVLSGIGLVIGLMIKFFSVPMLIFGTLVGTVMVVLYLLDKQEKKE